MKLGVVVGVLVGVLIGVTAAFATTNFIDGTRFLAHTQEYQTGYVAGVSDMIWLVADTGNKYVTDAVSCLNRHTEWKTDDALAIVRAGLAKSPGDSQYTMASSASEYLRQACP